MAHQPRAIDAIARGLLTSSTPCTATATATASLLLVVHSPYNPLHQLPPLIGAAAIAAGDLIYVTGGFDKFKNPNREAFTINVGRMRALTLALAHAPPAKYPSTDQEETP